MHILLKRILVVGAVSFVVAAGVIYVLFNQKFKDTSKEKSDFTIAAMDFIAEFKKSDSLANKKYIEKIVTVNGTVSEIENIDSSVNIKMIDTSSGSYTIFEFQKEQLANAKKLKQGDVVSIKGSCSGGVYSEILATEFISFKRCILLK